jgi:hypothetical protein
LVGGIDDSAVGDAGDFHGLTTEDTESTEEGN